MKINKNHYVLNLLYTYTIPKLQYYQIGLYFVFLPRNCDLLFCNPNNLISLRDSL